MRQSKLTIIHSLQDTSGHNLQYTVTFKQIKRQKNALSLENIIQAMLLLQNSKYRQSFNVENVTHEKISWTSQNVEVLAVKVKGSHETVSVPFTVFSLLCCGGLKWLKYSQKKETQSNRVGVVYDLKMYRDNQSTKRYLQQHQILPRLMYLTRNPSLNPKNWCYLLCLFLKDIPN